MVLPGVGVRAWQYHRALRPGESKRNRFEIQYRTSLTPNLIIFVFNAGRGKWARSRILDLGSTSIAGRVLKSLLRKWLARTWYPFCVCFLSGDCFAWGEEEEGRVGANKRNGSEHRVAGSADGNSDLLRVTRRKLSCGTIGYRGIFSCPCDLDLLQCLFSVLCWTFRFSRILSTTRVMN